MRVILDPKFSADEGWLPAPDMTPREFLEHVVKPNIADLRANPGSSRHAHNAVLTSDALAGHIYFWLHRQLSVLPGFKDDDIGYRNDLASRHLAYRILRDLAAALKHVALMRRGKEGRLIPRIVRTSGQMAARPSVFDPAVFDPDVFDASYLVVVHTDDDEVPRALGDIVAEGLAVLEAEMQKHGL
jgi:hypothetical protein